MVRGKYQHRFRHRRQKPGDSMLHRRTASLTGIITAIIKNISSMLITNTKVNMHAIARPVRIGFGHKAGSQTMFTGHAFGDLLEQHRIICNFQTIRPMQ